MLPALDLSNSSFSVFLSAFNEPVLASQLLNYSNGANEQLWTQWLNRRTSLMDFSSLN